MLPREIKLSVSRRTSPQREMVAKAMGSRKDGRACPSKTSFLPLKCTQSERAQTFQHPYQNPRHIKEAI